MNHALKTLFSATGISLMAAAPVVADTRTIAVEIIHNGIIAGDRSLIETHVAENIIPHNPSAGPGRDGVLAYVDFLTTLDAPVPSDKGVALFLWRAIDADGQLVDFKLTARRDAKAAKAFLNKAIERVWLHRPVSICTDKAPTYRKVKRDINQRWHILNWVANFPYLAGKQGE